VLANKEWRAELSVMMGYFIPFFLAPLLDIYEHSAQEEIVDEIHEFTLMSPSLSESISDEFLIEEEVESVFDERYSVSYRNHTQPFMGDRAPGRFYSYEEFILLPTDDLNARRQMDLKSIIRPYSLHNQKAYTKGCFAPFRVTKAGTPDSFFRQYKIFNVFNAVKDGVAVYDEKFKSRQRARSRRFFRLVNTYIHSQSMSQLYAENFTENKREYPDFIGFRHARRRRKEWRKPRKYRKLMWKTAFALRKTKAIPIKHLPTRGDTELERYQLKKWMTWFYWGRPTRVLKWRRSRTQQEAARIRIHTLNGKNENLQRST